ncbi:hypothetical protein OG601_24090 [Streptomyces sp. NBC_01239]|uniref:hypothetical protein n=1 Tax=Streptomyces sp. NBC_01239 TaxID=2903792 RepID=UPI00224EEE5A|nr:hypothetical protein [Streptomyces sp. NBC_01239]MCX4813683.1 hypothetical protein [Streptomyces sp. NBC_01239]
MDPIFEKHMKGLSLEALEKSPDYRRAACEMDPIRFAIIYLPETVRDADTGETTFSPVHEEWAELAKTWARKTPRKRAENRHAVIAPRNLGKSSWWYLIFPIWWAAYGYSKFTVAYANADTQAQNHLRTFRKELDENQRLREDFPSLCAPKRRIRGMSDGDSAGARFCGNGFVFIAKGIDAQSLGLKVGNLRPDCIVLDDAEPDAANYSPYMKAQRLSSIQNAILPQNAVANVVWTGTVTMYGSCVHDLVRHAKGEKAADLDWVQEERFQVHHHKPFIEDPRTGLEASVWPTNPIFDLDEMNAIRHTAQFKLNFENDPLGAAGLLWQPGDIRYADFPCDAGTYISVDPIVSKNNLRSDLTGVAVVGCAVDPTTQQRRALVKFAAGVRMTGRELKRYLEGVLELHPEASVLLVETNQGGDLFTEAFEDLPIRVVTYKSKEPKEVRAGRLLSLYQHRPEPLIYHSERFHQAETEMFTYPNMGDDITDAIGGAVLRWVRPEKRIKAKMGMVYPT